MNKLILLVLPVLFLTGCDPKEEQDAVTIAQDTVEIAIPGSDKVTDGEKLVADGIKAVSDVMDEKKGATLKSH